MWNWHKINYGEREILNLYLQARANAKSVVKPGYTTSLQHFQQGELNSEKEKERKTVP